MTTYLFKRVGDGRCGFAKVSVDIAPGVPPLLPRLNPRLSVRQACFAPLLEQARRGVQDALHECGATSVGVEVADASFTVVDSTPQAAYVAGFMAAAKLLGFEADYEPRCEQGTWKIQHRPSGRVAAVPTAADSWRGAHE